EIQVVALMQSNIDPHSYKPVESDVAKLNSATIVLHNGLHLEGKMTDILDKVGRSKPVYAMSSALKQNDLIEAGPNVYDPHIWFDLNLWARCVEGLGGFLALQYPEHSDDIIANTERYAAELRSAHADFATALMDLPDSNRAMVTAHDAFSYFGRAFAIEVKGLQGVSTAAEFGVNDMRSTAEFIIERELTTVFTETSVNSKSIEALKEAVEQKGGEVKLGEPLFSDALGEKGTPEATLIGAFKYNTTQILNSLK
ncbi:MAG: metal ABC transporter solute-binding protein, Zn/Mn family, partial [Schleiferiaceae bacterium]